MKRTTFDAYVRLHRLMWLNICQEIAKEKHPVDIYTLKHNWIYKNKTHAINSCFLCQCAHILRDEADNENPDTMFQHTRGVSCRYCPCVWPSTGDKDHEYMCEYNYHLNDYGIIHGYGLWMTADNVYGEYYHLIDIKCELPPNYLRKVDKLWKKQCKICFKIAMLPVRDDLDHMITESL